MLENKLQKISACSHSFFEQFASEFRLCCEEEKDSAPNSHVPKDDHKNGWVQLVAPHFIQDLKEESEIQKIFTLTQPNVPLQRHELDEFKIRIHYSSHSIHVSYKDTQVCVRPCVFYKETCPKLTTNIIERIPLYHPSIINIGTALTKVQLTN